MAFVHDTKTLKPAFAVLRIKSNFNAVYGRTKAFWQRQSASGVRHHLKLRAYAASA
jgi:hypothetical protein